MISKIISLMLSSPIFMLANINIFIESKHTGGICRQNMHLSIESASKWDIITITNGASWSIEF